MVAELTASIIFTSFTIIFGKRFIKQRNRLKARRRDLHATMILISGLISLLINIDIIQSEQFAKLLNTIPADVAELIAYIYVGIVLISLLNMFRFNLGENR